MPYQCIKCPKSFLKVCNVLRHVKENHDEDVEENLDDFDSETAVLEITEDDVSFVVERDTENALYTDGNYDIIKGIRKNFKLQIR